VYQPPSAGTAIGGQRGSIGGSIGAPIGSGALGRSSLEYEDGYNGPTFDYESKASPPEPGSAFPGLGLGLGGSRWAPTGAPRSPHPRGLLTPARPTGAAAAGKAAGGGAPTAQSLHEKAALPSVWGAMPLLTRLS
jgi:hypothetical protein